MPTPTYAIAVVGGATAGAEAAALFAAHGILTVVFEQNARPYGKIEDGLPRWHAALRQKEYAAIDRKLSSENVHFVPNTKIGRDVALEEITRDWGFHAVVLANGAWRDRLLPIEGAERYVGKGLVYQNAFIGWFNHRHEKGYTGERFQALPGTIVVGGGLASIDVAKAIQLELALEALRARGIEEDLLELETKGIPKTLEAHGLTWEDLGIEPAVIYYRRRLEDMPLVSMPDDANDDTRAKIEKSRLRALEKATSKFLFRVEPLRAPVGLVTEGDRLMGIELAVTRMEGGKLVTTGERVVARGPQVISSIGSIPEPIAGIAMKGELYAYTDWDLGRLEAFPTLFSAGNVVTGRGNIVDSRKHAKHVAEHVSEQYLAIAEAVKRLPPLSDEQAATLLERVRERQQQVGYDGDYARWIEAAKPPEFA
jgi:NADPH-dependent glutamate synthase beta subunit-like oxidoreductase